MFVNFYYLLKEHKIPVSIQEFLLLLKAIDVGLIHDLDTLYYIGRSLLVKDVGFFDKFDQVFAAYFKDAEFPYNITEELLEWLRTPLSPPEIPPAIRDMLATMSPEELYRLFEQRLREQAERHNGGNKWIGTGGGSPFGHGASNPQPGIRVGGESMYHMAVKVALKRQFQNYRHDLILDVRSIGLALKKLRILARVGQQDELDVDGTVDKTCKNAGDIELLYRKKRKNNVKVLLLMDAGGSMEPFAELVSRLFSAAHQATHFRKFRYYYFHNCIYDDVFADMHRETRVPTTWLLQNLDKSYHVIIVGDAAMAPWELTNKDGIIYYYASNETPGIAWLRRLREHFPHSIWWNPDQNPYSGAISRNMISQVFPMFPLTLDGIDQGIQELVGRTHVDPKTQPQIKANFAL